MFCMSTMEGITAHCRNFAPLYSIQEEAATGTSNSGLTFYLKQYDLIAENVVNTFIQGESMNKISYIYTRINKDQIRLAAMPGSHWNVSLPDNTMDDIPVLLGLIKC